MQVGGASIDSCIVTHRMSVKEGIVHDCHDESVILQTSSKELLEGGLRGLACVCSSSHAISEQLSEHSMAPLAAQLQHSSPKVQV